MKRYHVLWIVLLPLCLIHPLSWATTAYVTDLFEITLRTGPSNENKIIAMLSSGEPLEVVETRDDWTLVRLVNSRGEEKEGWVLSRYLIKRQPWETQAKGLLKQNASLREKLGMLERKSEESSQREAEFKKELQHTSETLKKVQTDFESLKNESSDFLELKEQYETTKSTLQTSQDIVQKLTEENEILKASQYVRWFLAGALVFLSALLMGLVLGRREKKHRKGLSGWKG
jgi:SH3 domain protein